MREKKYRRKIEPGGRGKSRDGIFEYTEHQIESNENIEEFTAFFKKLIRTDLNTTGAEARLQEIIKNTTRYLNAKGFLSPIETEQHSAALKSSGYPKKATPEYFAYQSCELAEIALSVLRRINDSEADKLAVLAMDAADKYHRYLFAEQWELHVLRGTKQQDSRPSPTKKKWAEELAEFLVKTYPGEKFPALWLKIPENETGERYDGFSVWRLSENDNEFLQAESLTAFPKPMPKETFRTQYITVARKKFN